jgi:hypothetical protein
MIGVTKFSNMKTKHGAQVGEKYLGIRCDRSYRALRDGSFERRFPRHFVPGYDRVSLRDTLADIRNSIWLVVSAKIGTWESQKRKIASFVPEDKNSNIFLTHTGKASYK